MEQLKYSNIFDAITEDPVEAADLQFRADLMLLLREYFRARDSILSERRQGKSRQADEDQVRRSRAGAGRLIYLPRLALDAGATAFLARLRSASTRCFISLYRDFAVSISF
jgi:hypothetical protein